MLATVTAILLLFLASDFLFLSKGSSYRLLGEDGKLREIHAAGAQGVVLGKLDKISKKSSMESFNHYDSVIRRRNVFQGRTVTGSGETTAPRKAIRLSELSAALSVQGIFLDENPRAMILDAKANATLTVTEGQYIDDILVKKIEKRKVVISYKDEEMDLLF